MICSWVVIEAHLIQFDMRGMTSQFPPASLQSKEVCPSASPSFSLTNTTIESTCLHWARALRASYRGRPCRWISCKWVQQLCYRSKYGGRWRGKVSGVYPHYQKCNIDILQRDESINSPNLIEETEYYSYIAKIKEIYFSI